jgi:class 3 adenylate cyclase
MTEPTGAASAEPPGIPSAVDTFLLADVRGFTTYTQRQGDEAGAAVTARFLALCTAVIAAHDGEVFGTAGDQALADFRSARAAGSFWP